MSFISKLATNLKPVKNYDSVYCSLAEKINTERMLPDVLKRTLDQIVVSSG